MQPSTLYNHKPKTVHTPCGRPILVIRASVPRTSGIEITGWATPASRDYRHANRLPWRERGGGKKGEQLNNQAVHLAGWPTPHVNSTTGPGSAGRQGGLNIQTAAQMAGWPTPTTSNTRTGKASSALSMKRENGSKVQQRLQDFAAIAGPARLTASGQMLTGCSAGMESGGQLNPAHSRWLMGLPAEWDDCAPTETPSTLKRRQPLSSQ